VRLPWMSRRDRRAWGAATTLADLGELTARWLEGDLKSRPGYQPRYGPDDETADLIPVLAAANRAGFVTDQSQPGIDEPGFDGARWQQKAAVDGYISDLDLLARIRDAATTAGLVVIVHPPGARRGPVADVVATTRDGEPVTSFGGRPSRRDIEFSWSGAGRPAACAAVDAHWLTLIDPDFNRNDRLWSVLGQTINPTRTQTGA
jgi:hypothetical protein